MPKLLPFLVLLIAGCKNTEQAPRPQSTSKEVRAPATNTPPREFPSVRSCASDSFINLLLAIQQNQIKSGDHRRFDDQVGCKLVLWHTEGEANTLPHPIISSITADDWVVFTYGNWSQPAGLLKIDDVSATRKRLAQNALLKRSTAIYAYSVLLQDVEYIGFKTVRTANGGELELPAFVALPSDHAAQQKAEKANAASEPSFKETEGKLVQSLCDIDNRIADAHGNPTPLPNPDRALIVRLNQQRDAILGELKRVGSRVTTCDLGMD
jgi:hypothetical protein